MGTTAQKIQYLDGTKTLLKDTINLTGAGITNDTFRSYASKLKQGYLDILNNGIDTLYNNFPKVSGIGSNLSLTPTYKAPIKLNEIQGDTFQNGTPTPSSPVPIESVTGLQNVTISNSDNTDSNTYEVNLGKNYFNKSVSPSSQNGTTTTELNTGIRATITSAGQNKYTAINLPNPSNLLGKTLTISANISISGTNTALIRFYWLNGNVLTSLIANSISTTGSGQITIPSSFPENTNGIAIVFSSNSGSSTSQVGDYVDYTNVQLEIGSQATSYSPYFTPIELNKIGTYEDSIKKSTGKNLFDKDTITENYRIGSDGLPYADNSCSLSDFIRVEPNTTYYINQTMSYQNTTALYDINKNYISPRIQSGNTFTTTSSTYYVRVSNLKTNINTLMLNEGSTALPYEPYGKVWYITKNIGEKIVEDNSGWGKSSRTDANKYYIYNYLDNGLHKKDTTTLVCNYLNCISQDQCDAGQLGLANLNGNGLMVQFALSDTDFDTLQKWKTFVGTYKPKVLYVLSTPIYEVITNTELIEQLESLNNAKSKDGTTNINVTSVDLSMILNVGVLKGDA